MSRPILLDTCALIWFANNETLRGGASNALMEMETEPGGIVTSPISAWEVGQLVARGRLRMSMEPMRWFQAILDGGMTLAPLPPSVLVGSSFLPGTPLRDPADKIMAATARAFDYRLMTRDQPLLDFAAEGHLQAIAC